MQDLIKRLKKNQEKRKYFQCTQSTKDLYPTHEECLQINKRKTDNSVEKLGKRHQTFHKGIKQIFHTRCN